MIELKLANRPGKVKKKGNEMTPGLPLKKPFRVQDGFLHTVPVNQRESHGTVWMEGMTAHEGLLVTYVSSETTARALGLMNHKFFYIEEMEAE